MICTHHPRLRSLAVGIVFIDLSTRLDADLIPGRVVQKALRCFLKRSVRATCLVLCFTWTHTAEPLQGTHFSVEEPGFVTKGFNFLCFTLNSWFSHSRVAPPLLMNLDTTKTDRVRTGDSQSLRAFLGVFAESVLVEP